MVTYVDRGAVDISFCLPVYNVRPYLEDCMNSILNQNLEKQSITYEIFCIDDGSSDGSYEWLLEWSSRTPQTRVEKNNENKGVSYTRNRLAREAKGKYIWYIDPDDILIRNIAGVFYQLAEKCNADIFLGNYIRVPESFADSDEYLFSGKWENICIKNTKDESPQDSSGKTMHAIWAGLFLRNFLLENNLAMNENMIAQEDTLFYYECFLKTQKVFKCDIPCYLYRQRPTSVMHMRNEERNRRYYLSMLEMLKVYQDHLANQDYDDRATLDHKILHSKQNITSCLASMQDKQYIKEQLRILEQKRIYPYTLRTESLRMRPFYLGLLTFLLPLRPFFWLYHHAYAYRLRVRT